MPEKRRKAGKLADSIAEAAIGNAVEKDFDDQYDDNTKAKVAGSPSDDEYKDSDDED